MVKIPQIINVVRASSAKGLNLKAIYLETVATLVGTSYNLLVGNPFRTYGETALILFQNIIIVLLVWHFNKEQTSTKIRASAVLVGLAAALFNVPMLEPVWPTQLREWGITPVDSMYNLMTLLYLIARVRCRVVGWRLGAGWSAAHGAQDFQLLFSSCRSPPTASFVPVHRDGRCTGVEVGRVEYYYRCVFGRFVCGGGGGGWMGWC